MCRCRRARRRRPPMSETMEGGCACGRVRYAVAIDDDDAYLCHCRMCQRATGSVSIAFKGVKRADVRWQGEPDWYDSSPIAERPYCRECGTSLGFRFKDGGDEMDLTVASFDDPSPVQAEASFRRREHPSRLAEYGRPAGDPDRGISRSWSTSGSRRPAASPDERSAASTTGLRPTRCRSPITRWERGGP